MFVCSNEGKITFSLKLVWKKSTILWLLVFSFSFFFFVFFHLENSLFWRSLVQKQRHDYWPKYNNNNKKEKKKNYQNGKAQESPKEKSIKLSNCNTWIVANVFFKVFVQIWIKNQMKLIEIKKCNNSWLKFLNKRVCKNFSKKKTKQTKHTEKKNEPNTFGFN